MQQRGAPLLESVVPEIAAALGATSELAPFRVDGAAVYRLMFTPPGHPGVRLTLWPSLARADVLAGHCAVVFKGVDRVLLFPGQEAVFQRDEPRGFLLVSCAGRVATAS